MDFLSWLARKEEAAGGAEQQAITQLGTRLVAVREGLGASAAVHEIHTALLCVTRRCADAASLAARSDSGAEESASSSLAHGECRLADSQDSHAED